MQLALDYAVARGLYRLTAQQNVTYCAMAAVLLKCVRAHQKTGSFVLTSALLLASGYLQQLKTVVNGLFLSSVSNPGASLADLDAGAAGVPLVR